MMSAQFYKPRAGNVREILNVLDMVDDDDGIVTIRWGRKHVRCHLSELREAFRQRQAGDPERIMRPTELHKYLGIARVTIWRMVKRGDFPEPLRLSGTEGRRSAVGWRRSVVTAWLDEREAEARR